MGPSGKSLLSSGFNPHILSRHAVSAFSGDKGFHQTQLDKYMSNSIAHSNLTWHTESLTSPASLGPRTTTQMRQRSEGPSRRSVSKKWEEMSRSWQIKGSCPAHYRFSRDCGTSYIFLWSCGWLRNIPLHIYLFSFLASLSCLLLLSNNELASQFALGSDSQEFWTNQFIVQLG